MTMVDGDEAYRRSVMSGWYQRGDQRGESVG
jgi:hypothetical protein